MNKTPIIASVVGIAATAVIAGAAVRTQTDFFSQLSVSESATAVSAQEFIAEAQEGDIRYVDYSIVEYVGEEGNDPDRIQHKSWFSENAVHDLSYMDFGEETESEPFINSTMVIQSEDAEVVCTDMPKQQLAALMEEVSDQLGIAEQIGTCRTVAPDSVLLQPTNEQGISDLELYTDPNEPHAVFLQFSTQGRIFQDMRQAYSVVAIATDHGPMVSGETISEDAPDSFRFLNKQVDGKHMHGLSIAREWGPDVGEQVVYVQLQQSAFDEKGIVETDLATEVFMVNLEEESVAVITDAELDALMRGTLQYASDANSFSMGHILTTMVEEVQDTIDASNGTDIGIQEWNGTEVTVVDYPGFEDEFAAETIRVYSHVDTGHLRGFSFIYDGVIESDIVINSMSIQRNADLEDFFSEEEWNKRTIRFFSDARF